MNITSLAPTPSTSTENRVVPCVRSQAANSLSGATAAPAAVAAVDGHGYQAAGDHAAHRFATTVALLGAHGNLFSFCHNFLSTKNSSFMFTLSGKSVKLLKLNLKLETD